MSLRIALESASIMIILRQSEPPSDIEYATVLPSSEKLNEPNEVVPSLEKVFGSKKSVSIPSFLRKTTY